ncbi:hypothetical protein P7K49_026987 [Saguinus oedipus]|uniref:Uncharacterized protein n=1 Tax=Saguinus oedipus TaxID=9490 RepID=A0ABQ9UFA4_SAGOE|nr:hypothetical protein P7K49_026987 [Saguinus oedipus]
MSHHWGYGKHNGECRRQPARRSPERRAPSPLAGPGPAAPAPAVYRGRGERWRLRCAPDSRSARGSPRRGFPSLLSCEATVEESLRPPEARRARGRGDAAWPRDPRTVPPGSRAGNHFNRT